VARSLALLCVCGISFAPAAEPPAGSRETYPKGHYAALDALPDWGGIWIVNYSARKTLEKPAAPVLKGKYLQDYHAWQQAVEATEGDVPHEGSYCRPPGLPMIMMTPQYPIEFLFTPGRVTIHHEAWMQWRNIYIDGRTHPDDLDATFNGHSIGTWQHGELVVDSVAIKPIVEISKGMKHSDKLHILERIHLAKGDPDTLVDEMTVEDPEALEKPWMRRLTYRRMRGGELLEFECAENDRNPVDASGHAEFQ
jgi:hypothetical protein